MPFVQRVVQPIYISRTKRPLTAGEITSTTEHGNTTTSVANKNASQRPATTVSNTLTDYEFEKVTNLTLSNALRQLSSLVLIANDIFTELNRELQIVGGRAVGLKGRIDKLEKIVDDFDPKLVTVPESDLATFVQIKNHFHTNRPIETSLFTPSTRSENLQQLYDAAAKTPVNAMEEMDRIMGQNERRSSDIFLCTPVLGQTRKRMKTNCNLDIETGRPAAVDELRKWTSSEAIGDITVTPDCVARVGYNSQNNSTLVENTMHSVNAGPSQDATDDFTVVSRFSEIPNDMPLDHRLPSPEEQCQIIALKFPAELIRVDTSSRRFERMCGGRKSILHVPLSIGEHNNLNDDVQTVKRRSRSRKPRNKRRNTIAGTDQKEIEEAVRRDDDNEPLASSIDNDDDPINVPRSKSNDILKKDSPTTDAVKTLARMSHFNTLKQWGRNRLRLMNRNSDDNKKEKVSDVDDINVYETVISKNKKKFMEKERKLLHERKPSYSSSEKSLTITSQSSSHSTQPASINPVKLRESSAIRRQRRSWLGHKDELNSSSGNWSASSESGRTSIGSEITAQPKSSASSTSLNHSHHPGSGPPSSIISRRRFLNTSASSSVTSEGTVTPDIQIHDSYDDETSSAYSCDTEGYYTSFHIDSGLKTLKEEEPITPLHSSSALSSTNSFGSSSNKTVLSAENEYELFGKGSTSTTASSAGTVCTTLMAAGSDRCLINGPAVPERKSSLTKLHRSGSNTSNSTLERSYSSSTVGSTLERNGTIKRNGILLKKEIPTKIASSQSNNRVESPDSGNNTSSSPIETNSNASPTYGGVRSNSEHEHSECSDFEGVERVERIRLKTTINSSRIPSMCIITPSNSDDDENPSAHKEDRKRERQSSPVQETDLDEIKFNTESASKANIKVQLMSINKETGYATVNTFEKSTPKPQSEFKKDVQHFKKTTLLPLNNMFGRLRGVLPQLKKSPVKDIVLQQNDPLYDNTGEYVTIADVTNNNQKKANGIYYSNDLVKRNLATVLSGKLNDETEYVSLNELPSNIRCESNLLSNSTISKLSKEDVKINMNRNEECTNGKDEEGIIKRSARVTLDAHGKVVFNSDSLKRRKGAHTTFLPGPYVKDLSEINNQNLNVLPVITTNVSGGVSNRKLMHVRPVISQSLHKPIANSEQNKQVDKVVIRADSTSSGVSEKVRMPIATIAPASSPSYQSQLITNEMAGSALKGAYVNVQGMSSRGNGNGNLLNSTNYHRNNELLYTKPDLQRLSHDQTDSGGKQYTSSTLPRHTTGLAVQKEKLPDIQASPFQRSNNIYWTLQARKQYNNNPKHLKEQQSTKDDFTLIKPVTSEMSPKRIEDLYSIPNKTKKQQELRSTPIGFATFFSPVKLDRNALPNENAIKISPIDPRNSSSFKTSTPSKADEHASKSSLNDDIRNKLHIQEGGFSSNNSSPISSGRSTPRTMLEPQCGQNLDPNDLARCSDRLGTPKTSLMDFKKLLLSKAGKSVATKPSAVEQLKLAKEIVKPTPTNLNSSINILNLSGSPKTFANRRMIRQGTFGSPNKTSPVGKSPRTNWKYNYRTDVMSTPIPEVNSEEDSSPNSSKDRNSKLPESHVEMTNEINEKGVIEESLNISGNIFLQAEENNFMRGESPIAVSGITRAHLMQARSQFLTGGGKIQSPIRSAQFRKGHYTGMSSNGKLDENNVEQENVNETNSPVMPSLETAFPTALARYVNDVTTIIT